MRVVERDALAVDQVHVGGPVGLECAQVHPVAGVAVLDDGVVLDQVRDEVLAVVAELAQLVVQAVEGREQHLGAVEEHLGIGHAPGVVDGHDAVAGRRLVDLRGHDREVGLVGRGGG